MVIQASQPIYVLVMLCLLLVTSQLQAATSASVDRNTISIDDSFTLTIRIDSAGSYSPPDLTSLEKDFQILGNRQNSRHMISNGRSESWTEWTITLMARHTGDFIIPALNVDGQPTGAIAIRVQEAAALPAGELAEVFLEASVDHDKVYVDQQLILSLRVFVAIKLDNMQLTDPEVDNASIRKISQNAFSRQVKGRTYNVHELRYAIFPQKSGELIIPQLMFSGSKSQGRRSMFSFSGQGTPIRKMTKPISIQVEPPPAIMGQQLWLPASSMTISENWSSDPATIRVGDSITRTITTTASGVLAAQLPPMDFASIAGAKFYPDHGQTESVENTDGILSIRKDSTAIIPTREGELKLPEIRLRWWDVNSDKLQEAIIPATTISVAAALPGTASNSLGNVDHSAASALPASESTTTALPQSQSALWPTLAALFFILWLLSTALWLRARQRPGPQSNAEPIAASPDKSAAAEKKAFKALVKACQQNALLQSRQAVIAWGQYFWPQASIRSLQDIQRCCEHPSLNNALLQMDNCMYGNNADSSQWSGENLLAIIRLIREKQQQQISRQKDSLAPLYKAA